jgi:hypothetical protein
MFLTDLDSRQDAPVHVLPGGSGKERPVGVSRDALTTLATGWPSRSLASREVTHDLATWRRPHKASLMRMAWESRNVGDGPVSSDLHAATSVETRCHLPVMRDGIDDDNHMCAQ